MTRKYKHVVNIGDVFGKLTITSNNKGNNWDCRCECGNTRTFPASDLVVGHDRSCGCLRNFHGMRYHAGYKSWQHMKDRCLNQNNQDYESYGGRGIQVHEDFVTSFPKFLEEMGERPSGRWSIGRIDNNGHYTYGNIRWENDEQQARNHSKSSLNTSGIVGVRRNTKVIAGTEYHAWIASWASETNKKRSKEFSCNKFGEDEAKRLAIEYRNKMIKELNLQGFGYADSHGSKREVYGSKDESRAEFRNAQEISELP